MNLILLSLQQWVRSLAGAGVQVTLLIIAVVAATMLLRRSRPVVRYALWSVVLIRLCLPFGLTTPLGLANFSRQIDRWNSTSPAAVDKSAAPLRLKSEAGKSIVSRTAERESSPAVPAVRDTAWPAAWGYCGMVWLVGVVMLSMLVFRRWLRLQRIVDASEPCHRPELLALVDELRARFGIGRTVGLRTLPPGADGLGPCAAGWRQPRILLPARLAKTWDLSTIEPILIHELAHIRRADVVVNAVQVIVQVIYWFHPLVWLANAQLRRERELICDDFAVLHSGSNSRRYGAAVLRAIEEVRLESAWSLAGVGMGESGLSQRLRRLLDGSYTVPRPMSIAAIGVILSIGIIGVLVASDAPRKGTLTAVSDLRSQAMADPVRAAGGVELAQNTAGKKSAGEDLAPGTLFTKEWKIPANVIPRPPDAGPASPSTLEIDSRGAKEWLIANGIVFADAATVAYIIPQSRLIVRNTRAQLDLIEALLENNRASGAPASAPAGAARAGNGNAVRNGAGFPKPAPDVVVTKTWKIPPNVLPPAPVPADPGKFAGDGGLARNWLIANGVVFQGKAAAVYDSQSGQLVVRNTQAQVDLIDAILEAETGPATLAPPGAAAPAAADGGPVIPKLELREATSVAAFKAITAATGIKIFYTPAEGDNARITISLTNIPAIEAIRYVTSLANLKFTSEKDGVHVSGK